jgi:hypothetical protein
MKTFKLIIVAVCVSTLALFLLGAECGVVPGLGYYIKFKVDGVEKNFDKGLTNYESEPFGNEVMGNGEAFFLAATPDVETGEDPPNNYIGITFDGTKTGTYTGFLQADLIFLENGKGWMDDVGTDDLVVTVTKYEDEGGVIEGTFSSTVIETEPDSVFKEITEGEFRVKRITDGTFVP